MTNTEFRSGVIKPVECLKEAWAAIKPNYWPLFGIAIVGVMLGGITMYILLGAMMCGIYLCYLRAIDGEKVEFDVLFKSFRYFWPSLPVIILFVGPMIGIFAVIYFPLIIATVMGARLSESELMSLVFGSLAIDLVLTILMVCLHTLLMFAFPLIVDRNLSGWQAIKVSAKSVWKNLGGVTGIWTLMFAVNLLGLAALCVGVYLTIPIILATQVVAYRKVFPKQENPPLSPPPPSAFNL